MYRSQRTFRASCLHRVHAASSYEIAFFFADWRNGDVSDLVARSELRGGTKLDEMEGIFQMALVVVFAAVLLVTGQLFLEYRSSKIFDGPAVAAVTSRA